MVCRPSLALFSSCNESVLQDGLDTEGTIPVIHKLFPIVRNFNVHHQFRRNYYSTRVSLVLLEKKVKECLESSQYSKLVLLLSSWMCRSQSVSEKSCAPLFGNALRPYRVPMNCCIRLSFFLIIMTHQSCNHFGDRCCKRSSCVRYGSLCAMEWPGTKADRVRIQFPGARIRGRTSFLSASLRFRQASFTFFRVFMFREQFRAGESMSDILDIQFVHESPLSSGYQNPKCPFWILWGRKFDFKSMGAKYLYDVNFNDWSNNCFSRNGGISSGLWVCSKKCVFSAKWDGISKTVVLVRFGLVAHSSRYPVPERCEFANLCELNSLGQWFEVLDVFPWSVSRCLSWRRHQRVHFPWTHALYCFFVHGFSSFEDSFLAILVRYQTELLTPIRNYSVNTELICRMILDKSSVFEASSLKCMVSFPFSVLRIPRLNALALVETGWLVSLTRCTICEATEFHFPLGGVLWVPIPLLFVSRTGERPVSLREFLRVRLVFFWIRNTNLIVSFFIFMSISLNIDMWRWSHLWISQVQCSVCANQHEFPEESAMM